MSKSDKELATEITIAWLNAVSSPSASRAFDGSWLKTDSIKSTYETAFKVISNSYNDSEK